jgi:N6-L-threonylcarbamoyladenine synthase
MRLIGLDTSCDETAAAVVEDGRRILSSAVASQDSLHARYGGVVPEVASRAHLESMLGVLERALEAAGVSIEELDAIAVTNAPGLIGALLVGLTAAKTLAWLAGRPLVAVNHVEAHLYAGRLMDPAPEYPYLGLIVSGGHTCLLWAEGPARIELLGSTLDDAAGEAFDKAAAILGLGYPGGPAVDRTARQGDPAAVRLPRTLLAPESLDFSFSGIKTALLYEAKGQNATRRSELRPGVNVADLAASFQEAVVDVLVEKLRRAAARTRTRAVVLGGGVAANSRLRLEVARLGGEAGFEVFVPPVNLCLDNAAMVAGLGYHHLRDGRIAALDLDADPTPIRR